MGNGIYQAVINTSMLTPGVYEIVAKAVWNVNGNLREEFSYGSLNVTTSTTTTTSTSTTTTTAGINVGLIAGVVIVIIIIAAAVFLIRRR
jgi:hypothetical protein